MASHAIPRNPHKFGHYPEPSPPETRSGGNDIIRRKNKPGPPSRYICTGRAAVCGPPSEGAGKCSTKEQSSKAWRRDLGLQSAAPGSAAAGGIGRACSLHRRWADHPVAESSRRYMCTLHPQLWAVHHPANANMASRRTKQRHGGHLGAPAQPLQLGPGLVHAARRGAVEPGRGRLQGGG